MTKAKRKGAFTPEENRACAKLYVRFALAQHAGERVNKSAAYRELIEGPLAARSRPSVEVKLMNMSACALEHGIFDFLPDGFVQGLKPAVNRQKGLSQFLNEELTKAITTKRVNDESK